MNILSADQAISLLFKEYPQFVDKNLIIIKQFKARDGRMFNTFLVKSDADNLKKFIAKGVVHKQHSLESEWFALKLLQERNADAPKLLLPDH